MSAQQEQHEDAEGNLVHGDRYISTGHEMIRKCSNCHLSMACPQYDIESTCAYEIPVILTTREQVGKTMASVVEMQVQRVFQARFAEELLGQELDPATGREIDRLFSIIERMNRAMADRDSLTLTVQATGSGASGGVLSSLFGKNVADAANALPGPVRSDDVIDTVAR